KAKPKLVIVDLRIGDENGIELLIHIRGLLPRATLVMVSGYLSIETTVASVKAGADAVINKPTTAARILKQLRDGVALRDPFAEAMPSLKKAEHDYIERALADTRGNIARTAKRLQIRRFT